MGHLKAVCRLKTEGQEERKASKANRSESTNVASSSSDKLPKQEDDELKVHEVLEQVGRHFACRPTEEDVLKHRVVYTPN